MEKSLYAEIAFHIVVKTRFGQLKNLSNAAVFSSNQIWCQLQTCMDIVITKHGWLHYKVDYMDIVITYIQPDATSVGTYSSVQNHQCNWDMNMNSRRVLASTTFQVLLPGFPTPTFHLVKLEQHGL